MNLKGYALSFIRKYPTLVERLSRFAHRISPETVVVLDYPLYSRPRWDQDNPHPELYDLINKKREAYKLTLQSFLHFTEYFTRIREQPDLGMDEKEPYWINRWMPALDGVALYCFLVTYKPKLYMEVGSGNSTKFAWRAITDHNLPTKIVSIDPSPREEIDPICDEIIRKQVEEIDLALFDRLDENDILYIDSSHRVFMNSDATTIFLDVLPRLKKGILVEIHDITLPYDYPFDWIERYYSEQYLLAAYLLAKGERFDIILPNTFISRDNELIGLLGSLWEKKEMKNVEKHGGSFWIRIK